VKEIDDGPLLVKNWEEGESLGAHGPNEKSSRAAREGLYLRVGGWTPQEVGNSRPRQRREGDRSEKNISRRKASTASETSITRGGGGFSRSAQIGGKCCRGTAVVSGGVFWTVQITRQSGRK